MKYKTFKEFWPYYLSEHSHPVNRIIHFIGTGLGLVFFIFTLYTLNFWLIPAGFVIGYAFAWAGHFFVEKNRPATFTYPFKSFISDWYMFYCILTGKIKKELEQSKIQDSK